MDPETDEIQMYCKTAEEQVVGNQNISGETAGKGEWMVPQIEADCCGHVPDEQNFSGEKGSKGMRMGDNLSGDRGGRSNIQGKGSEKCDAGNEGSSEMTPIGQIGSGPKKRQRTILQYIGEAQMERWREQKPTEKEAMQDASSQQKESGIGYLQAPAEPPNRSGMTGAQKGRKGNPQEETKLRTDAP